jgi:hypothetical protein
MRFLQWGWTQAIQSPHRCADNLLLHGMRGAVRTAPFLKEFTGAAHPRIVGRRGSPMQEGRKNAGVSRPAGLNIRCRTAQPCEVGARL